MPPTLTIALCAATVTSAAAGAATPDDLAKRLGSARAVLQVLQATIDRTIPGAVAAKAVCVVVVPGYKKATFVVGGQSGEGAATCRTAKGWSAPAMVQVTGSSFGLQSGGQSADLVLLGITADSRHRLAGGPVKLGTDAATLAGPIATPATAAGTVPSDAEFLGYARAKGLLAGFDLSGATVIPSAADTQTLYGKVVFPAQILSGAVPTPAAAQDYVAALAQLFPPPPSTGSPSHMPRTKARSRFPVQARAAD